jgi:hypothetical protein
MKDDDDFLIPAQSRKVAAIDIRRRNRENRDCFTDSEKSKARDLQEQISHAYEWTTVHQMNYRKKYITIKVEKGKLYQSQLAIKRLNEELGDIGIEYHETVYGNVTYRLPRMLV